MFGGTHKAVSSYPNFQGNFESLATLEGFAKMVQTVLSQPSCASPALGGWAEAWKNGIFTVGICLEHAFINHHQWVFWLSWLKYAVSIYIYTRQKFWHVCFGDSKSTLPNSVFCWSSKLFPIHLHLLVIYVDPFPNRNYLLGAPSPT